MKKRYIIFLLILAGTLVALSANKPDLTKAINLFRHGDFSELKQFTDSAKRAGFNPQNNKQLDSLCEIASRIRLDFSLSEPKAEAQIRTKIGHFTLANKKSWENRDWLEYKIIDGQKCYFNRAVAT